MTTHTMNILRRRLGLEEGDSSKDHIIANWDARKKVEEIAAWELGDRTWAPQFEAWFRECGLILVEDKKK